MGLNSQMIAWDDEFCSELARRGYRVIRFDNRDIGLSTRFDSAGVPDVSAAFMTVMQGKSVDAPYRLSDMAADTAGLLDALGIDKAHVVGASMGGAIAQTLAIEHPSRLRTLTSIMATTGAPGLPPPTADALAVLFKAPAADQAAYFESYAQTWKVLRAGSFPLDEARDLARAGQTWARGLNPAGSARQLVAILASGSRKEALGGGARADAGAAWRCRSARPASLRRRHRREHSRREAGRDQGHGPRAADLDVAADHRCHRGSRRVDDFPIATRGDPPMPATDPTKPPSRELLLLEIRAIWELSAFFTTYPLLRLAPRGDGHPVLVLPGLGGERRLDAAAAPLPAGPGLRRARLGAGPQPRPAARRRGEAAATGSPSCTSGTAARSA